MIIELGLTGLATWGLYKLVNRKDKTRVDVQDDYYEDIEKDEVLISDERPQGWSEFIGNKDVVESLRVACEFARRTDNTLGNILLLGSAGTGKTSLARIIAKEMGYCFFDMNGTTMSNMTDIYHTVTRMAKWLEERDEKVILFLDEIHALDGNTAMVRETLKPLIEEHIFKTNLLKMDDGTMKRIRPWSHQLPPFTVIGATDQDIKDKAIRSRFRVYTLAKYSTLEIEKIVRNFCKKTDKEFDDGAIRLIAERSRLNPRLAIHNTKEIWEYAFVRDMKYATYALAKEVLQERKKIYEYGLTLDDIRYLQKLNSVGRPTGETTLRKTLRLPDVTFQETEELLFDLGFAEATPRGRKITEVGSEWLGKENT